MNEKGIKSINELAIKYLGYESSQKLNRLKKDGNKPSYDILNDLFEAFPDIPMNWYFTNQTDLQISNEFVKTNEIDIFHLQRKVTYLERIKDLYEDRINALEEELEHYHQKEHKGIA